MGLINARNLRRAKELLDKNRHKVGDIVDKAGTQLDKVSKGKTSNVTAKAADAARKYSEGATSSIGRQVPVDDASFHAGAPVDPGRQPAASAAGVAAANAVTAAATAAAKLMNNKVAQAQVSRTQEAAGWSPPTPGGEKIQATHRPPGPRTTSDDTTDQPDA